MNNLFNYMQECSDFLADVEFENDSEYQHLIKIIHNLLNNCEIQLKHEIRNSMLQNQHQLLDSKMNGTCAFVYNTNEPFFFTDYRVQETFSSTGRIAIIEYDTKGKFNAYYCLKLCSVINDGCEWIAAPLVARLSDSKFVSIDYVRQNSAHLFEHCVRAVEPEILLSKALIASFVG